jgi:acyl-CoA thioesterase
VALFCSGPTGRFLFIPPARDNCFNTFSQEINTMPVFDEALALHMTEDGHWRALADNRYEAITGMYGGWTAAVILKAVILQSGQEFSPSAMTINYVHKIEPGSEVKIEAKLVGNGRSIQHWQAQIMEVDGARILAHAMLVFSARRETDGHTQPSMPDVPDPETLEVFIPSWTKGRAFQFADQRPVHGFPAFARHDTTSMAWVREGEARKIDHVQLAFLSDLYPPRPFFWSDGPRPYATTTLSVYFHATADELDSVDDDFALNEAIGTRGERSTSGQQARIWSRDGKLLMTTEQLGWFR